MRSYQDFIARKTQEFGDKFDASDLDPRFIEFFNSGQRIKVRSFGEVVTGTVGVTTGWKPAFLLMRRSNSVGSTWLLGPHDEILARQVGRTYVEVN